MAAPMTAEVMMNSSIKKLVILISFYDFVDS